MQYIGFGAAAALAAVAVYLLIERRRLFKIISERRRDIRILKRLLHSEEVLKEEEARYGNNGLKRRYQSNEHR